MCLCKVDLTQLQAVLRDGPFLPGWLQQNKKQNPTKQNKTKQTKVNKTGPQQTGGKMLQAEPITWQVYPLFIIVVFATFS